MQREEVRIICPTSCAHAESRRKVESLKLRYTRGRVVIGNRLYWRQPRVCRSNIIIFITSPFRGQSASRAALDSDRPAALVKKNVQGRGCVCTAHRHRRDANNKCNNAVHANHLSPFRRKIHGRMKDGTAICGRCLYWRNESITDVARRCTYIDVYEHNGVLHGGEWKEADDCLYDIGMWSMFVTRCVIIFMIRYVVTWSMILVRGICLQWSL